MTPITKILLATDFGPSSDAALEHAAALARAFDAALTVVHVYEAPVFASPGAPGAMLDELSSALEKSARGGLDRVLEKLVGRVPRVAAILRLGSAWSQINDVARETGADLVVVGTHGRRGVPRMLIGSVAEKVVRTSPVPVLTVHGSAPVASASASASASEAGT